MNPVFSIIIPIYNTEKYLETALASCSSQSFSNIEVVCVNDGSTDNSGVIIEQYVQKDSRFQLITQENKGLSAARNAGLKVAKGKWIIFLDSDDFLEENACEVLYRKADEKPADIITYSTLPFPEEDITEWLKKTLTVKPAYYLCFSEDVLFQNPNSTPFVWRQCYCSEFLKKTGILFEENVRYGEDLVFQFKVFPQAQKFLYIDDCLYHYRLSRKNSLMEKAEKNEQFKLMQHMANAEIICQFWKEKGYLEKYGKSLFAWLNDYVVYHALKQNDISNVKERFLKMTKDYRLLQYLKYLPIKKQIKWFVFNNKH